MSKTSYHEQRLAASAALRKKVFSLKKQGLLQVEIAEKLKISRQRVHQILSQL